MSGAPALWTKHRGIALGIAAEFHVPGMDADDVRQEALLALWVAARSYEKGRGTFPAYARLSVRADLTDLLRTATRAKRQPVDLPEPTCEQPRLPGVMEAFHELTARQQDAVRAFVRDGVADKNAIYEARRKLRAAA